MITPFLAVVAVCAAVSSTQGIDMNAIAKEGGQLASGVKTQFNKASAKAKAASAKATTEMKKQQATLQHEAKKAQDKVNTAGAKAADAAKTQAAVAGDAVKAGADKAKKASVAAAKTAQKTAENVKDNATHAANTAAHHAKKAAGMPSEKPKHPEPFEYDSQVTSAKSLGVGSFLSRSGGEATMRKSPTKVYDSSGSDLSTSLINPTDLEKGLDA